MCAPRESSLNQYFDTFLATRDKNTNRKCLAIWNSTLVINQLRLIVNGVEKIYQTEIIEEYRYHSFFCHLDDHEIDSITITGINDFDIDTYKLENLTMDGIALLELIAKKKGFPLKNHGIDMERAAITLLNDYRQGFLGRMSLETPESRMLMMSHQTTLTEENPSQDKET
jgi:ribosome biogenesis GTPase A